MKLSIIIPTLNEEENIDKLLSFLISHHDRSHFEIIVVDGGSGDGTLELITQYEDVFLIESELSSRSIQMNIGARNAQNEVLYFVHADVALPQSFYQDIKWALKKSPYGGYRYKFLSGNPLLKINGYFSRFPMMWCRGGDQTLFITQEFFEELGGFDEHYCVMEDFDLLRRAKPYATYYIIKNDVFVSARKYQDNNYLKVQLTNLKAFKMFNKGEPPSRIRNFYKAALGLKDY
ncbi:MAG: TIGR04283 family arsenosugar biosynthesis glycosyltransferase [Marinoscillum sp.]